LTTLQKLLWNGEVHTTVSAEALRWAVRYYWQMRQPSEINRCWNDQKGDHDWRDSDFRAWDSAAPTGQTTYWDDDLLGFMDTTAGSEEAELQIEIPKRRKELQEQVSKDPDNKKAKAKLEKFQKAVEELRAARERCNKMEEVGEDTAGIEREIQKLRTKAGLKGKAIARRGVLEIARAISTTPFAGDITFNARSGEKDRRSLYGTEVHATRYQYGFAVTPERLRVKNRAADAVEAIGNLGEVAGNQGRFLFDFSPESIVLRITDDPAPRILYCFQEDESGLIHAPELMRRLRVMDIAGSELYVGGPICGNPEFTEEMTKHNVYQNQGVKETVHQFITVLTQRLNRKEG